MRRESPLVVVFLLCSRIHRSVHFRLQYFLVQVIGSFENAHDLSAIFRLHGLDLFGHVIGDWNCWIINIFVVRPQDFWNYQGGLELFESTLQCSWR